MSDSLSPWLCEHIISIAETYGAQLTSVPAADKKKKKVQIKEFLTYQREGQEDTYIWAIVSDKHHTIPIKFTREAVAECSRNSYANTRFTQNKGAVVSIAKFRPIHSRVPLGKNGKPTPEAHLALECNSVSLLGSSGESTFGNPKPITSNPDIRLWSDSLNHDGGAGNVLKERKLQREIESDTVAEHITMDPPVAMPAPLPRIDAIVKPIHAPARNTRVNDMASYKARWNFVERNPYLREPPLEETNLNEEAPAAFPSPAPEQGKFQSASPAPEESKSRSASPALEESPATRSQSVRSGTPLSTWELSPSPTAVKESSLPERTKIDHPTSSIAAPTPAQRIISAPESPYPPGSGSILVDELALSETRPPVARKVPRPNSPEERREMTGPSQVLVPNSDTSQSQHTQPPQSQMSDHSEPWAGQDLWWVRGVLEKALLHKLVL